MRMPSGTDTRTLVVTVLVFCIVAAAGCARVDPMSEEEYTLVRQEVSPRVDEGMTPLLSSDGVYIFDTGIDRDVGIETAAAQVASNPPTNQAVPPGGTVVRILPVLAIETDENLSRDLDSLNAGDYVVVVRTPSGDLDAFVLGTVSDNGSWVFGPFSGDQPIFQTLASEGYSDSAGVVPGWFDNRFVDWLVVVTDERSYAVILRLPPVSSVSVQGVLVVPGSEYPIEYVTAGMTIEQ